MRMTRLIKRSLKQTRLLTEAPRPHLRFFGQVRGSGLPTVGRAKGPYLIVRANKCRVVFVVMVERPNALADPVVTQQTTESEAISILSRVRF